MAEGSLLESLQASIQMREFKEQKFLEKLSADTRRSLISELNSTKSDTREVLCLVKKLPGRRALQELFERVQEISSKQSTIFRIGCVILALILVQLSLTVYLVMVV